MSFMVFWLNDEQLEFVFQKRASRLPRWRARLWSRNRSRNRSRSPRWPRRNPAQRSPPQTLPKAPKSKRPLRTSQTRNMTCLPWKSSDESVYKLPEEFHMLFDADEECLVPRVLPAPYLGVAVFFWFNLVLFCYFPFYVLNYGSSVL